MAKNKLKTFTFIADYRGGTYCTQVQAETINKSVRKWTEKLKVEIEEIQYLGYKIIEELEAVSKDKDNQPTPLKGLKNVWCANYTTRQGSFSINIIQTQTDS